MRPGRLVVLLRRAALTYGFIIPFCMVILFPFFVMLSSALKTDDEIFVEIQDVFGNRHVEDARSQVT